MKIRNFFNKNFIWIIGTIPFILIVIQLIYSIIQRQTYYFIYIEIEQFFFWLMFIVSMIINLKLWIKLRKERDISNLPIKKFVKNSVVLVLSVSVMFACFHFLVYKYITDSYIVDEEVLSAQQDKELKRFSIVRTRLYHEIKICNDINDKLDKCDTIITNRKYNRFLGVIKLASIEKFYSYHNDYTLSFLVSQDIDPPSPPGLNDKSERDSNNFKGREIEGSQLKIANDTFVFSIYNNKDLESYFDTIFINPDTIAADCIHQLLKKYVLNNREKIELISNNMIYIKQRGLPLSSFTYDSLMKSLFHDQSLFKPNSFLSKLLMIFHVLSIIYIIWPIIHLGLDKIRK